MPNNNSDKYTINYEDIELYTSTDNQILGIYTGYTNGKMVLQTLNAEVEYIINSSKVHRKVSVVVSDLITAIMDKNNNIESIDTVLPESISEEDIVNAIKTGVDEDFKFYNNREIYKSSAIVNEGYFSRMKIKDPNNSK